MQGDVRDLPGLTEAARGCDKGIHLAVRAHPFHASEVIDVNVSGAFNFITAARQHRFRNAILAGSAPVHLDVIDQRHLMPTAADEDHQCDLSKVLQEVIVQDIHAHGMSAMCLRFGHIVRGELEQKLSIPIPLSKFDYCRAGWIAIEDMVTACVAALEQPPDHICQSIINMSPDGHYSLSF